MDDMRAVEELFTEKRPGDVDDTGVSGYRTKTTRAGNQIDIDCYPLIDNRAARRALRNAARQREAQERVNQRNRIRQLKYLMDCNFTQSGVLLTLTHADAVTNAEAQKQVRNFLLKVKRRYIKLGLEFKYILVSERTDGEGNEVRLHHHLLLPGGMDRDALEDLWRHGLSRTQRLKPDDNGFEGLAKYLCKGAGKHKMTRRPGITRWRTFSCSRNLKKPRVSIADKKLSRRRVERMASELPGAAKEIFEKLYPGYRFLSIDIRVTEQFSGAYIYTRMVRD